MRVNAAYADARPLDPRALERRIGELDHGVDAFRSYPLDGIDQSLMRRDMDHAKFWGGEHHRIIGGVGEFCEDLGVARIEMSALV